MMPNLATTIQGFEDTLRLFIVKKTVTDHDLVESSKIRKPLWFEGQLQPIHNTELLVKTEGERKFKWRTLFTDMDLEVDTVIEDQEGTTYRIMASSDWKQSGFNQYQLIEGTGV